MYLTNKYLFPPRGPSRHGRDGSPSLSFGDAARAELPRVPTPRATRLVCIEMVHGAAGSTTIRTPEKPLGPRGGGKRDFDLTASSLGSLEPFATYSPSSATPIAATPKPSRFPRLAAITSARARCSSRSRTRRRPRAPTSTWDVPRSDLRPALRPGDADPLDAACDRERRPGGRLLLWLRLHLHGHHQLGLADRVPFRRSGTRGSLRPALRLRRNGQRSAPRGGAQTRASSTGFRTRSRG